MEMKSHIKRWQQERWRGPGTRLGQKREMQEYSGQRCVETEEKKGMEREAQRWGQSCKKAEQGIRENQRGGKWGNSLSEKGQKNGQV